MSEPAYATAVFVKTGQFGVLLTWTGVPNESIYRTVVRCNAYEHSYITLDTSVLFEQSFLTGITSGDNLNFIIETQYTDDKPHHVLTTAATFTDWIPDAPTGVTSSIENGTIVLNWVSESPCRIFRSDYYGTDIELVNRHEGNSSNELNSYTFSILPEDYGQGYTYSIFALNLTDISIAATTYIVVIGTFTPPSAPRVLVVVPKNTGAFISWDAPEDAGGTEGVSYDISITNQATSTATNITPDGNEHLATGLTNGTTYTVSVFARNSLGDSTAISTQVVPAPSVPESVVELSVEAADKSAILSWSPGDNGGYPITGYRIQKRLRTVDENNEEIVDTEVYTNGDIGNQYVTVATTLNLTYTVTNLTAGREYSFSVVAINQVGDSEPQTTKTQIFGTPSVPLDFRIISVDQEEQEVHFKFKSSIDNGGSELSYFINIIVNGLDVTSFGVSLSPFTDANQECDARFDGLGFVEENTNYSFTIQVSNQGFASVPSPIVGPVRFTGVGTTGIPLAPTDITVVPSAASALVSWTPTSSDPAITSYRIYSNPDNKLVNTATADATSLNVTGLKNGTSYTFAVVAINEVGSSYSATCTPSTVPGAPKVTVVGGNGQATLTWLSKPAVGAPITGYTLTCNQTATLPENPTSPVTITGLTNGTSYIFSVTATNIIGTSAVGASKAVIPTSIPDVPTNFAVVALVKSFQVTWQPPVSNGGLAITEYTITYTRSGITAVAKAKPVTPYSFTVLKLVTGTYSVKMQAKNKLGLSAFTEPITVTVD